MCMCVLQVHCGHEAIVACSKCTKDAMGQNFCSSPLQCLVPYACESCIVVEVTGAVESVEGAIGKLGAKMQNEKREEIVQQIGEMLASANTHADSQHA